MHGKKEEEYSRCFESYNVCSKRSVIDGYTDGARKDTEHFRFTRITNMYIKSVASVRPVLEIAGLNTHIENV